MDEKMQLALIQAVTEDYVKETGDQKPTEKKLQSYIEKKGGKKYLQEKMQSLAQKAEHGAKLNYFKKLKNICSDDEELVYFKRGGNIDCGCVKKSEEGGPIKKKLPNSANGVNEFKKKREEERKKKLTEPQVRNKQRTTPTTTTVRIPKRTKAEQDRIDKLSEEDYFNGKAYIQGRACGGRMKKKITVIGK